ncbi:MAG: PTS fructose transporter subunit IIA [Gammaproteobacteria bacterium]|nr:MAG: PTS fructose transporter subunit IIA [Gammaproteobacteria bacterium]
MKVGLLIIAHERVASALVETAENMLGHCPLALATLPGEGDCDPDAACERARAQVGALEKGDGVLVLTDIYGSTPSNIACRLAADLPVAVVSGINLPMLVRVMNYPELELRELANKALSGGRDGVLECCDGDSR